MGWFNFNTNNNTPTSTTEEPEGHSLESFLAKVNVGDKDLSQPFINDYVVGNGGYVWFGEDNLYPELVNNFYLNSSIHSACVNFKVNSILGGGVVFDNYKSLTQDLKIEIKKFKLRVNFDNLIETFTKDFIKHNRAYILLRKKNNKFISAKNLDPAKVRNNAIGIYKKLETFYVSEDYARYQTTKQIKPYHPSCKDEYQILELRGSTGGSDTYPLPEYAGSGNWLYLDGEISYLMKQNIVNSINPSMIFKFPVDSTPQQKSFIKKMLQNAGRGAKNMVRILTFFGPKEQHPQIETVQTTNNDKLYETTLNEIKDNICFSHNINPSIIGIKVAGQLGNTQEIKTSYQQFEKGWATPKRRKIENFFNQFIGIWGINQAITINKFQLIDDEFVEVDEETNKVNKALNQLSPLVATKVLESMTPNEIRKLAELKPIEGGDVQKSVVENKEIVTENLEKEQHVQKNEVNDGLKGLTAKENADIYRIIRDYSRGKLNRAIAVARLKAYGIDDADVDNILEG